MWNSRGDESIGERFLEGLMDVRDIAREEEELPKVESFEVSAKYVIYTDLDDLEVPAVGRPARSQTRETKRVGGREVRREKRLVHCARKVSARANSGSGSFDSTCQALTRSHARSSFLVSFFELPPPLTPIDAASHTTANPPLREVRSCGL